MASLLTWVELGLFQSHRVYEWCRRRSSMVSFGFKLTRMATSMFLPKKESERLSRWIILNKGNNIHVVSNIGHRAVGLSKCFTIVALTRCKLISGLRILALIGSLSLIRGTSESRGTSRLEIAPFRLLFNEIVVGLMSQ